MFAGMWADPDASPKQTARIDTDMKWNGLGGKFDQGETPEDCATREIREESGPKSIPSS